MSLRGVPPQRDDVAISGDCFPRNKFGVAMTVRQQCKLYNVLRVISGASPYNIQDLMFKPSEFKTFDYTP